MKNDDQPIHPVKVNTDVYAGLSKREHFANSAMSQMLAKYSFIAYSIDEMAVKSVQIADALLAELNKPQKK